MDHDNAIRLVLIADDNADAGETLGLFLQRLGLRTIVVTDGEAAVEAASREMPDLAILDLGMPKKDGWTACSEIRALPAGAEARIIALSGWGAPDARGKSAEAGFDAHWTKPAEASELLRVLLTAGR
jgi:CheY-like chemotaxis protein